MHIAQRTDAVRFPQAVADLGEDRSRLLVAFPRRLVFGQHAAVHIAQRLDAPGFLAPVAQRPRGAQALPQGPPQLRRVSPVPQVVPHRPDQLQRLSRLPPRRAPHHHLYHVRPFLVQPPVALCLQGALLLCRRRIVPRQPPHRPLCRRAALPGIGVDQRVAHLVTSTLPQQHPVAHQLPQRLPGLALRRLQGGRYRMRVKGRHRQQPRHPQRFPCLLAHLAHAPVQQYLHALQLVCSLVQRRQRVFLQPGQVLFHLLLHLGQVAPH